MNNPMSDSIFFYKTGAHDKELCCVEPGAFLLFLTVLLTTYCSLQECKAFLTLKRMSYLFSKGTKPDTKPSLDRQPLVSFSSLSPSRSCDCVPLSPLLAPSGLASLREAATPHRDSTDHSFLVDTWPKETYVSV